MKAIVLSYDINRPLVEHMIATFARCWPDHPFTFRIPYQQNRDFRSCLGPVEAVKTPALIKPCVLKLIEDLPDEEWVYWCIDDKFLLELNVDVANHLVHWVSAINNPFVSSLLFCRCRRMCGPPFVSKNPVASTEQGIHLLRRFDFNQIWLHQMLRVKVLRALFTGFPDRAFYAIEMDGFTQQGDDAQKTPDDQLFYVTQQNFMVLGESTRGGELTRTCFNSLNNYQLPIPKEFKILDEEIKMGGCKHLPTRDSICLDFK
jgi:hypothetical protein